MDVKLKYDLISYQKAALERMLDMEEKFKGGALALNAGLGKSFTVMALTARKSEGPNLYALPPNLLDQWKSEILKLTHLTVTIAEDPKNIEAYVAEKPDIILIKTSMLMNIPAKFNHTWYRIVVDEAHEIRNPKTDISTVLRSMKAKFRWGLSGTFFINFKKDFYGMYLFLKIGPEDPDVYNDLIDDGHISRLLLIRSNKNDLKELNLPKLNDKKVYIKISDEEKTHLAKLRNELLQNRGTISSIEAMHKARVATSIVKNIAVTEKFKAVTKLIIEILQRNNTDKILLFSSFMTVIDAYKVWLDERKIKCEKYVGETTMSKRTQIIKAFNEKNKIRVLIIGFQCGNSGINLQVANHVILNEPYWNEPIQEQAIARAYRKGQKKEVNVYRFICQDTIDARVDYIVTEKKYNLYELTSIDNIL